MRVMILGLALALSGPVQAGLVMEFHGTGGAAVGPRGRVPHGGGTRIFQLEGGRGRVDALGPDGKIAHTTLLYPDEGTYIEIRHDKRTYVRRTKADIEASLAKAEAAMKALGNPDELVKRMEAQLAKLPKEQRAMVEAQIRKSVPRQPTAAKPVPPPRKIADGAKVGRWTCTRYESWFPLSTEERIETCYLSYESGELDAQDVAFFKKLLAFSASLLERAKKFSGGLPLMASLPAESQGIPIETVTYRGKELVRRDELTRLEHRAVASSDLQIPDGYRETTEEKAFQGPLDGNPAAGTILRRNPNRNPR